MQRWVLMGLRRPGKHKFYPMMDGFEHFDGADGLRQDKGYTLRPPGIIYLCDDSLLLVLI